VILAVVSGKGGTGKTTVATSLAAAWLPEGPVLLADCDPEGPNAHHFLPPLGELIETPVAVPMPTIDAAACDLCGDCVDVCAFNALAKLPHRWVCCAAGLRETSDSCKACCRSASPAPPR
jgi:MinD superfamily P-loop ATPase